MSELKFLVIGDFHYKKKMYPATVADLDKALRDASDNRIDICVHLGDFCNDYKGSPELFRKYIDNEYGIDVFGVYGNHELESADNSMQRVTPLLSNKTDKLVYGTGSGLIEDDSIGYSYYDTGDFRLIFLDTNYSLTPEGEYEHNRTGSWGKPKENTEANSLGTDQVGWLRRVVLDAADKALTCIVFSHASLSGIWRSSPEHGTVRAIFAEANAKRENTVILAINGHEHASLINSADGVTYFYCPAAVNAWWQSAKFYPYAETDPDNPRFTFDYFDYDEEGNLKGSFKMPYSELSMGAQSLFFESPLFARITVNTDGKIKIEGRKTRRAYGVSIELDERYDPEIRDFEN